MELEELSRKAESKKTPAELVAALIADSWCEVFEKGALGYEINIGGALKDIPALKNSKRFAGRGAFIEKGVLARLKGLERLIDVEMFSVMRSLMHEMTSVSVIISCAERSRDFDTDAVFTTFRDLMEPKTKIAGVRKKNHNRGWGLGLVANDSVISGGAYHWHELDEEKDVTKIFIAPFLSVKDELIAYKCAHVRDYARTR